MYQNPQLEELFKALGTATDANGSQNLTPQITSKVISEYAAMVPVLRNALPTITWPTRVVDWRERRSVGYAQTVADLANVPVTDETFADGQASMSIYTMLGLLSNFAISVDQPLVDVKKLFIDGMTKAMVRLEGKYILQGDPNNTGNPGIFAALNAGATAGVFGSGSTADFSLFAAMANYQKRKGFDQGPRVWAVSPGLEPVLAAAAYNKVRYLGEAQNGQFGFPLVDGTITILGIPVLVDPYMAVQQQVTGETMSGSGTSYTFANKFVITSTYDDEASASFTPPVLKVAGTTVTNYTLSVAADGTTTATFASAPASAPTATYYYEQQNVLLLNLMPDKIVRAINQDLQLDTDLMNPYTQLATPIRMSQFSTVAVRNTAAHLLASDVAVPLAANF